MKVIEKNGKIFLQADFKNLTDKQRGFMRELSFVGVFWGKFDEEGDVSLLGTETANPPYLKRCYRAIRYYALLKDVEITQEANALIDGYEEVVKAYLIAEDEKHQERKHIFELQKAVTRAQFKMKDGCGFCEHKKIIKGEHYCTYTNKPCYKKPEEWEREFYAQREAKLLGVNCEFWATPYPVSGCVYLVKGRQAEIELQELEEKEKKGENNGNI